MMIKDLIGKIIETKDSQKWFVVKLDNRLMAYNQNGYFGIGDSNPEDYNIVRVFKIKETDLMNLDDILECIWEK